MHDIDQIVREALAKMEDESNQVFQIGIPPQELAELLIDLPGGSVFQVSITAKKIA